MIDLPVTEGAKVFGQLTDDVVKLGQLVTVAALEIVGREEVEGALEEIE